MRIISVLFFIFLISEKSQATDLACFDLLGKLGRYKPGFIPRLVDLKKSGKVYKWEFEYDPNLFSRIIATTFTEILKRENKDSRFLELEGVLKLRVWEQRFGFMKEHQLEAELWGYQTVIAGLSRRFEREQYLTSLTTSDFLSGFFRRQSTIYVEISGSLGLDLPNIHLTLRPNAQGDKVQLRLIQVKSKTAKAPHSDMMQSLSSEIDQVIADY